MTDVLFVGLMFVLFALSVVLVRVCDRIVGSADVTVLATPDTPEPIEAVAA
jgi:hypothetical protein